MTTADRFDDLPPGQVLEDYYTEIAGRVLDLRERAKQMDLSTDETRALADLERALSEEDDELTPDEQEWMREVEAEFERE